MNKELAVEYLVSRLPDIVRRRLDRNATFGAHLGLRTRTVVTVGGVGRFDEEELLVRAREALAGRAESPLTGVDGVEAVLARDAEGLTLRSSRGDQERRAARVDELLILSPEDPERRATVDRLIEQVGPTAPDFGASSVAAAERDLSVEEATALLHEVWGGVAAVQARTALALKEGGSVRQLVPSALGYYERFCGPAPDGLETETYLTEVLPGYRRQLLGRDLARGLGIGLLGNLRHDLSPAPWLDGVADDPLWEALAACEPHRDPFSLVGALDIALGRQHDGRYRAFAGEAARTLAADELTRPDGLDAYAVLPLFARLASARLILAERGASRPPHWRRLCAWMQAGLLGRLCWSVEVDLEAVRASVDGAETLAVAYGRTLDLHEAPMSAAGEATAPRLRAEVLGRLLLLRRRHEAAGRGVPGAAAMARACERSNTRGLPPGWELPGPLEGHVRPARTLPPDTADAMARRLEHAPGANTWAQLAHLSQVCVLGGDLRERMRGSLQAFGTPRDAEGRREMSASLERACRVAAAHRDEALARAVGTSVLRQAPTVDGREVAGMLGVLLLAGAGFADGEGRTAWLSDQLAELAARLPLAAVPHLKSCLEKFRHVSPACVGFSARAEFLSAAA